MKITIGQCTKFKKLVNVGSGQAQKLIKDYVLEVTCSCGQVNEFMVDITQL